MTAPPGPTLELLTVGRICVDLYANEAGASFTDPQTFTKSIGGSATNVAIAAGAPRSPGGGVHQGRRRSVRGVREHKLDLFGVDKRFVFTHPDMPTPLAFAAMDPPEDPKLLMYRYPMGPDQTLEIDEIDRQAALDVPILWLTGAWFSKEPARATCWELLSIRKRKAHVVFDLDYRANFWPSPEAAAPTSARYSTTSRSPWAIASSARLPLGRPIRRKRLADCWPAAWNWRSSRWAAMV